MELYQEILFHVFANTKLQVSFPELPPLDPAQIVDQACYRALCRIKSILEDDTLEDRECFEKIEAIVCALEDLGSDGGSRHDFG